MQAQREKQLQTQTAEAESARAAADAARISANQAQKASSDQVAALQAALIKLRSQLDGMEASASDLGALRSKVALLNNSEAVETALTAIRGSLGKGFADAEKQIDAALPGVERKPSIHILYTDDDQRDVARQVKASLESSGFEVS